MAAGYQELAPPPGLDAHLACVWTSGDGATRVLPDGCADVVLDDGRLVVAGSATRPALVRATPGQPRIGVRFRIGSAGPVLDLAADELRDRSVELVELWGSEGRRLEDRVLAAQHPRAALLALVRGIAARLPAHGDPQVRGAALALAREAVSVREAADRVGVGERQLRRRFERAVGYGPGTFRRVQRFQRFLLLAERQPAAPLARLALEAGYSDQAHLTRESGRLAGLPPAALRAVGPVAAGDKSV